MLRRRPWRGTGSGYRTGAWMPSWREERLLVAFLADIPALQARQFRIDLIYDAGPPLRGVVQEHDGPRDHLREMVRTSRRTGALDSLAGVLLEAMREDLGAQWFALAVTILTTRGPLPAGCLLDIVGELHELPPEFGTGAVAQYVAERRKDGRPLDARTLPVALLRLYDAQVDRADPAGPRARLLRFLELLGEEAAAHPRGDRLTRLLTRVGKRHGVTATAVPDLGGRADTECQVIVQIRIEEVGPPVGEDSPMAGRSYFLRGFRYESDGGDEPRFRCATDPTAVFLGAELDRRGREFLLAWQEHADVAPGATKRYEFLLDDSLLGHPVELWPSGATGVPLSYGSRVVVRSLKRYDDSTIHSQWARRWEALDRDCAPGDALERIGWMDPHTTSEANAPAEQRSFPAGKYPPLRLTRLADLEDWLRDHKDMSCLGLGSPYVLHDPLIRQAVRDALRYDGIPVMVWRRDAGDPVLLLDALRERCSPALLAELPDSVLVARQYERYDAQSVGSHITLLWDDPTCVFRNQNSQMPGTRGTREGAA